jgi:hypothetical protein
MVTEQWVTSADNSMVGTGITAGLTGAGAPFVEALGVVEMAGGVFYLAKPPQNEVPVAFKLVECRNDYLKFANRSHDFPKTIEYTLHSPLRMVALVSGDNKQFDIDFSRQAGALTNNVARVKAYVAAYNQRDLNQMLKATHEDIAWMSVYDHKVAVETNNQKALKAALEQHFSRSNQSVSSLSGVASYGNFVSAIEKVSSVKNGKPRSACSLSVYQFDGELIKGVWYYPAQSCENE